MLIGGYQKLTLIDYPGKVATVVFTVGCNFRCPFCHNPDIVAPEKELARQFKPIEKEFFTFLGKRKGKLDGVCVTGGEPTIYPDLPDFLRKIKSMGFLVKLDSNGTNPNMLQRIFDEKLSDFIAMDIKNRPEKYAETAGLESIDIKKVKESVKLIMKSGISYEFRTTVVPGLHEESDFDEIAKWIVGAPVYYLQPFRDENILDPKLREKVEGKTLDLEKIRMRLAEKLTKVAIRG